MKVKSTPVHNPHDDGSHTYRVKPIANGHIVEHSHQDGQGNYKSTETYYPTAPVISIAAPSQPSTAPAVTSALGKSAVTKAAKPSAITARPPIAPKVLSASSASTGALKGISANVIKRKKS